MDDGGGGSTYYVLATYTERGRGAPSPARMARTEDHTIILHTYSTVRPCGVAAGVRQQVYLTVAKRRGMPVCRFCSLYIK